MGAAAVLAEHAADGLQVVAPFGQDAGHEQLADLLIPEIGPAFVVLGALRLVDQAFEGVEAHEALVGLEAGTEAEGGELARDVGGELLGGAHEGAFQGGGELHHRFIVDSILSPSGEKANPKVRGVFRGGPAKKQAARVGGL